MADHKFIDGKCRWCGADLERARDGLDPAECWTRSPAWRAVVEEAEALAEAQRVDVAHRIGCERKIEEIDARMAKRAIQITQVEAAKEVLRGTTDL